jgi:hypothetical protein
MQLGENLFVNNWEIIWGFGILIKEKFNILDKG